jgi:hypothetical protein
MVLTSLVRRARGRVQRRLDEDEEDARAEKMEHEERVQVHDDDLGGGTRAGCRRGSMATCC